MFQGRAAGETASGGPYQSLARGERFATRAALPRLHGCKEGQAIWRRNQISAGQQASYLPHKRRDLRGIREQTRAAAGF